VCTRTFCVLIVARHSPCARERRGDRFRVATVGYRGCDDTTSVPVRSCHVRRGGNRELFDFKLRCGHRGHLTDWLGLRFDSRARHEDQGAGACPTEANLTGVQVMRGGAEGVDYFNFKLRCGAAWREVVGLPFYELKETRSVTCPSEQVVTGVRVHRGFQDWGSKDTYEFQLQCMHTTELGATPAGGLLDSLAELLASARGASIVDDAWQQFASLLDSGADDTHAAAEERSRKRRSELLQAAREL